MILLVVGAFVGHVIMMVVCTAAVVRAINRVHGRLDRLPPRVVARMANGDELYRED